MAVFRVEKTRDFTVMSNHHLRNTALSLKAKGLHSLMLSLPENWDFTLAGLAHICRDGLSSIRAAIEELEEQGYLKRRRLRNEKGQLADTEYTILERPNTSTSPPKPICENRTQVEKPICDFPILDKPTLGFPTQGKPMLENHTQSSTQLSSPNKLNTHGSSIESINLAPGTQNRSMDSMDEIDRYRSLIMDNLEYDCLCSQHGRERMDEAVELILETVCSKRATIRIAGDEFPREVVKSRLLKLDSSHLEYAFDCMDKNTTKVRNIKAYLLTTLYNTPVTIDSYYRAEVNHDMHGGGF